MTMCGISQGMTPLSSYNHGRKDKTAVKYILSLALTTATFCGLAWFGISVLFAGEIVSVFIDPASSPVIHADTVRAFRIYAASFVLIGVNVVTATFFSTIERPVYGIILSSSRGMVVMVITLYIMSSVFGVLGIWLSPTISETLCAVIGVALLARSRVITFHRKERRE
jgi:Na+-driven multidrug efflux pump